jgi:hypothetical protein
MATSEIEFSSSEYLFNKKFQDEMLLDKKEYRNHSLFIFGKALHFTKQGWKCVLHTNFFTQIWSKHFQNVILRVSFQLETHTCKANHSICIYT